MIIIDFSQVAVANLMQHVREANKYKNEAAPETILSEDLLRHMVLNSIRLINHQFKREYGEMVIACDNKKYWRKEAFPYYKANRKKAKESIEIDWSFVYQCFDKFKTELAESFPYRVIDVEGAEADDVIGTLVFEFGTVMGRNKPILIVSGDKDFLQLQSYSNVDQYSWIKKEFLKTDNPERYLLEHIIRGDAGDGIPNFQMSGDCFVLGQRQKSIYQTKVDIWVKQSPEMFCNKTSLEFYKRNELLIDLSNIPDYVRDNVMASFEDQAGKKKNPNTVINYFMKHSLRNLQEYIPHF